MTHLDDLASQTALRHNEERIRVGERGQALTGAEAKGLTDLPARLGLLVEPSRRGGRRVVECHRLQCTARRSRTSPAAIVGAARDPPPPCRPEPETREDEEEFDVVSRFRFRRRPACGGRARGRRERSNRTCSISAASLDKNMGTPPDTRPDAASRHVGGSEASAAEGTWTRARPVRAPSRSGWIVSNYACAMAAWRRLISLVS
jgi:hypothetical protein